MRSVLWVAVAVGALLLGACADDEAPDPLVEGLTDLCRGADENVDLEEQESAFFDRAHDAVHDLAERVTDVDPGVGGELLEAKQKIEVALTETFDESIPDQAFTRLIAAANEALAELELEPVSC